jgi:hypothetical protein
LKLTIPVTSQATELIDTSQDCDGGRLQQLEPKEFKKVPHVWPKPKNIAPCFNGFIVSKF